MYHPPAMMHPQPPPNMTRRQQSFSNLAYGGVDMQEAQQQYMTYVPQYMPFYPPTYHGKMSYPEMPPHCPPNGSRCEVSPASPRKNGKAPRKPRTTNIVFPRRKAGETQRESEPVVITLELLQKYFDLPLHVAAKELGICATAIKKACRKVGVMRWPFRDHRFLRTPSAQAAQKKDAEDEAAAEEVAASEAETASPTNESHDERSSPSSDDEPAQPAVVKTEVKAEPEAASEDPNGFLSLCDDESLEELYKDVSFPKACADFASEETHACSMMWMQA